MNDEMTKYAPKQISLTELLTFYFIRVCIINFFHFELLYIYNIDIYVYILLY